MPATSQLIFSFCQNPDHLIKTGLGNPLGYCPKMLHIVCCSQEVDPDPIALADFEDIFHSVGGVRAWSGERLTSPLVLSDTFDRNYGHWCRNKSRYDPNELLQSCYIQG